jgi:hypothetical protein
VQNTKEKAQDRAIQHPQEAAATTLETDQQPGIFFISVALALLIFSLLAFSTALSLTSVADIFTIFLGIANIFVGITFILQKNIPRNFGFITLAIFSFLVGIMLEIDHFTANFTQALFSIPGLISLSSGVFFATLPETRKDLRFVMLSGFLISLSILMIAQDLSLIYNIFSILAALFGFAGAILFFLRR